LIGRAAACATASVAATANPAAAQSKIFFMVPAPESLDFYTLRAAEVFP
jgi:hypothetical protein